MFEDVTEILTRYGVDIVGALLILLVGFWVAKKVDKGLRKVLAKSKKIDDTLAGFFASIARYVILAVVIIAALNQFGVETTSLLAVMGAAGLAVGLALKDTLSNVAAGVMLLMFRPFKVGDFIETSGHSGTVKELNLFVTELATGDNIQIIIPNGSVWGASLKNFSAHATRRVDLVFGISYDDDIEKAMEVIKSVIDADERAKQDPAPLLVVSELGDSSVNITTRVWANTADYWGLRFALTKRVKQRFDEEGITIPFPCTTVYRVDQA